MIKKERISLRIPEHCGINTRLDQILAKIFHQYSRTMFKKWILNKQVSINGNIIEKPNTFVNSGDIIIINIISEKKYSFAENIFLNIVYEDDDILVINKPINFVVHPGAGNINGTVLNALLYKDDLFYKIPRAGIVHRLDKNTTGLMLIAKNVTSYKNLIESLKNREIVREYEAVVVGNIISGGTIEQPIGRHMKYRTKMCVSSIGKKAITHFRIVERFKYHTHLKINLETGRTHQIRVHMLHLRYPVLGDSVYRGTCITPKGMSTMLLKKISYFSRPALHASKLKFIHPKTNKLMEFNIVLPNDMQKLINILKKN
ncbi:23S rRNA pseudouridine(1911/1915/1917) synthase RluD [Buchnera aphidicola (Pemphigus obesinymphae)]|uniref:23S rRNA pseudouridine(1911/1915/1917) synthase RluD n=1 Tax=Buchnera aphidicola TaxID=9 RepID=UPI0022372EE2|nr:23S rRNA pseudouridine(1911/1915/1917) synthase RluD [Buchnera aphidicola]MCW5196660.1 23S rRNA pseudouridine(1911/1915/1917) synthase RluD [Buchnera aphidicola (Pemphigus obesinymphae)]